MILKLKIQNYFRYIVARYIVTPLIYGIRYKPVSTALKELSFYHEA